MPEAGWIVESEYGYMAGETAAHELLKLAERPTAVVAHNDLIAIGAMKAFMEAGLRIPNDISVVGFDDIAAASYVQPPLTTVAYPKRQMGRAGIEMLLERLSSEEKMPTGTLKLPVELVVRASTGPAK
jgi:LacI family repressor for deo operon, udp, cdd, tsx, nupC, and nupG